MEIKVKESYIFFFFLQVIFYSTFYMFMYIYERLGTTYSEYIHVYLQLVD